MSAVVTHLVEEALLLPSEVRTELVEAILEGAVPSEEFLAGQLEVIAGGMENVRDGSSRLVPAVNAHRMVLASLQADA
jgi:hypothetical protein